jgi:outer membrane protein assembly factor BamD
MLKKYVFISILLSSLVLLGSCTFNTAKKIRDPKKKYEKAVDYYVLGKYAKAQILLEDVILSLRMTEEGEDALFKFADSHYNMKDYILAGYYFRKYVEDYPKGKYAEISQFMSAKCYFLDAPKSKLEQSATITALQEFELFITKYPNSEKISECNDYVDALRNKLEKKSFENAKLYYDIGYYNAASIALKNSLDNYPDSKYKEEILYYIVLSKYKYAKNSIMTKQEERYKSVIKATEKFTEKFPKSSYIKEIESIYAVSKKELTKSNSII